MKKPAFISIIKCNIHLTIIFSLLSVVLTQSPDFNLTINVSGGGYDYDLIIGFSPVASDKYDPGIDKYAPPPSPPGTFDAALEWNNDRWYAQIVQGDTSDLLEHVWNIQLQFPKNGPINLHWDNGCMAPLGTFFLQDLFGGDLVNVDMTTADNVVIDNPDLKMIQLRVTPKPYFPKQPPAGFEFTPNPASGTIIGIVTINSQSANKCDWIAAFDEHGNCAGSGVLVINKGVSWINIPIYADDSTTPHIDEGMNTGEKFVLKLWDASSGEILEYSEKFDCWSNQKGAPMPGCGGVGKSYDFTIKK